jgi:hypothetical protein
MFELAEWTRRRSAPARTDLCRLLLRWGEIRRGLARGEIDPTPHLRGLERWPFLLPLYSTALRLERQALLQTLRARQTQRSMKGAGFCCPATRPPRNWEEAKARASAEPTYACWFCWRDGGRIRAAVIALVPSQRYFCAICLMRHPGLFGARTLPGFKDAALPPPPSASADAEGPL